MGIGMLGSHFHKNAQEIYAGFIALLFGVTELQENPAGPRFRKRWEYLEDSELIRLYRRSLPVEEIAEQPGSDVPGVAMRLINSWWVTCPPEVAKTLGLNEDEVEITTRKRGGNIVIAQLVSEMGKVTPIREEDNEVMQLVKFILGGIGWTTFFLGIGVYLILYFIFYVVFAGFRN
jgi:hypothetical protein